MAILKTVKKIIGLSGQDYLTGGVAAEDIYGLTGDDTLRGNGGNDRLFGGIGKDTAVFSGKFADYNFANPAGGLQVTHARGTKIDGADFVAADVECLKFADITIDLTINHAPLAINDVNGRDVVRERGGLSNATAGDAVASGNVLANDSDIEVTLHRQTLRVANPGTYTGKFGTLTLNANGVWTYALNDADTDTQGLRLGQSATDAFFYTVSDGAGGTAVGKVTITIAGANDTPVAVADRNGTDTVVEAGGTANTLPGDPSATGNVLTNDTDIDVGDTKTVATAGTFTGVYGTLTLAANGTWTYTLKNADADTQSLTQGQSVNDVFTYTMKDTAGATSASTLSIKITGTNDAPAVTAFTDGAVTEEATTPTLRNTGTITFDDVDLSDTHIVSVVHAHGSNMLGGSMTASVTTSAAGSSAGEVTWNYSVSNAATQFLAKDQTTTESFSVTIDDGHGSTVTQDITVTLTGTNDSPVFTDIADTFTALGAAEQVNTQAAGNQYIPFISNLANDKFLVTWTDHNSGMRQGQLLDANGEKAGGEFSITPALSGYDRENIELVDGRLVVFSAFTAPFGRMLDADGHILPGSVEPPANLSSYVYTAALTGGGFVIAASVNGFVDIGVQAYDGSGAKIGAQWIVPSGTFNEFVVKDVVALSDGGYLALYDLVGGGLQALRFDGSGTTIGGTYALGSLASDISLFGDIDSARLPDGRVIVTWAQKDTGGNKQVYAKFLDSDGTPVGLAFQVNSATSGVDAFPKITLTTNGNIALNWYGDGAHRVQFFDTGGMRIGAEQVISTSVGMAHFAIANVIYSTPTPDGGVFYSWRGLDGSGEGAIGRYLQGDGTFSSGDINLGPTTTADQFGEESAVNSKGVLVALSSDFSGADGSGWGIFMQRFQLPGNNDNADLLTEDTTLPASGTISFTDVDLNDTHTVVGGAGVYTGTGPAAGMLTASVTADTTGAGTGGLVTWSYTFNSAAAQYLAQGEIKVETFEITLSDGHETTMKVISLSITGTNDAPMVAVVDVTGGVTEDLTPLGDLSDSGTIAFADADHSDVHQVSVTDTSPGALGVLSAVIATDSAGNGLGGAIDWIYSVASSAVEYLAEGETRIETFTIRLADLYGGAVDRMVSITITGANDAAVVAALSATISEDEPLSQDLLAGATDVDGDMLFVVDMPTSIISTEGRILGTGDFTVTGSTFALTTQGLAAFNALAENAADSFVFDFGVSDGSVTTQNAFSVTINGVNDAPEFTEADDTYDFGPINESQGAGVVVGTVAALDPDNGDSVLYAITGGDPAGHFTIDAATGEISTARTLDFETTASYALIVEARDRVSGGLTDVATVNISVGNVPETALPNASFELGFLNWSTDGSFATVTSTDAGGSSVVPTDGSYFAALSSDPTFGGTPITDAAIETFLGLAAGKLDTLTANNATDGSAIKTTAFLSAGQTLSFDYRFDSTDYLPYNDFAFFTIAPTFATKLADIQSVGDYGDSGWQTYTYVAPTSGTYTIGFGVVDTNDSGVASLLYLDDLRIV